MNDAVALEGADGVLWVQPRTLAVTQVSGERVERAQGDVAVAVLCDVLARLGDAAAVLEALSRLDPDPPLVLEALRSVTRVLLPASRRVVEVRAAREGRPLTVRVESPEASLRELDSRLRLAPKEEVLELLSPAVLLPQGALGLAGRVAVEWTAQGARIPADGGVGVLSGWLAGASVETIDDALVPRVSLLGRRERFFPEVAAAPPGRMPAGPAEVRWRLVELGVDVVWQGGEVTACRWP